MAKQPSNFVGGSTVIRDLDVAHGFHQTKFLTSTAFVHALGMLAQVLGMHNITSRDERGSLSLRLVPTHRESSGPCRLRQVQLRLSRYRRLESEDPLLFQAHNAAYALAYYEVVNIRCQAEGQGRGPYITIEVYDGSRRMSSIVDPECKDVWS